MKFIFLILLLLGCKSTGNSLKDQRIIHSDGRVETVGLETSSKVEIYAESQNDFRLFFMQDGVNKTNGFYYRSVDTGGVNGVLEEKIQPEYLYDGKPYKPTIEPFLEPASNSQRRIKV